MADDAGVEERVEALVVHFDRSKDKAGRKGTVVLVGRPREIVLELLETPAVQASGLLFPSGPLAGAYEDRQPIDRGELIDFLHEAEAKAEVAHVDGRAYHGIKRRFATFAGATDAAAKQSGTTKEMLERRYVQDDLLPKVELALQLDGLRSSSQDGE